LDRAAELECDQIVRLSNNKIVGMQIGCMSIHQGYTVVIDDCIVSVVGPPLELCVRLAGIDPKRRELGVLGGRRKCAKLGCGCVCGIRKSASTEA
jgi:hypothetical protein